MSRIGGDDEDAFPNSGKLDSQTTAGQTTQAKLVLQEDHLRTRTEQGSTRGAWGSTTSSTCAGHLCLCNVCNQIILTD